MKKLTKYFCLLLFIGIVQIHGNEENLTTNNYSKTSAVELNTAFVLAVRNHNIELIQELLQAGANVLTPISYYWTCGDCDYLVESTPLIFAVRHNYSDLVRVLLEAKQDLNVAFCSAIREGLEEIVVEFIKSGVDINHVNENKDSPLILAVKNARSSAEYSLQACWAYKSRWEERRQIIGHLLEAGANVKHIDEYGRTALMYAVIEHDINTVKKLLEINDMHKVSFFGFGSKPINYEDVDGNTALILAIKRVQCSYINNQEYNICINSQNIIKTLLETPGIDIEHINKDNETAIQLLEKFTK